MYLINIPSNLKRFLYEYDHSVFYECNKAAVIENSKRFGNNYTQNKQMNEKIVPEIIYFSTVMERLYLSYGLISGTLLGKNK